MGRKKPSQINAAFLLQCGLTGGGTMRNNASH
jgi:hypothetical protein